MKDEGRQHKVYRWLRKKGWQEYVAMPIILARKDELGNLEKFYIRNFCPILNCKGRKQKVKKNRPGKRERRANSRKGTGSQETTPVELGGEMGNSFLLTKTLRTIGHARKRVELSVMQGTEWCKRWSVIKRCFGMTEIEVDGRRVLLRYAKTQMLTERKFTVVRVVESVNDRDRHFLTALLRIPLYRRMLYNREFTIDQLIGLYYGIREFKEKRSRAILRGVVSRTIKSRFAISIRNRVIVRVEYEVGLSKWKVSESCKRRIRQTCTSEKMAEFVCRRMRVVWVRHKTVGEIMCNHRRFARKEEQLMTCTCSELKFPKSEEGHVKFRFSEKIETVSGLRNLKNVPIPSRRDGRALARCANEAMEAFFGHGQVRLFQREELQSCYRVVREEQGGLTTNQTVMVRRQLEGLVIMPLDHNMGDTMACCPVIYANAIREMFVENQAFVRQTEDESTIIEKCRQTYIKEGYTKTMKWDVKGCLGRAYIIPKHKDTTRWRPICPSYSDPAGRMSKVVGKAIDHMLWNLPRNTNFNLKSTQQLIGRIETINKSGTLGSAKKGMMAASFDIKNIFSKLPHDAIIRAVEWVVEIYEGKGLDHVRVKLRGKGATFGKAAGEVGWRTVPFRMLIRFIRFDLGHTFIVAAGKILQQTKGIPMGKSNSPALACLLCAYYENSFLSALGVDRCLIQGCRLVDDVSVFISFQIDKRESLHKAVEILKKFEHCYNDKLTLKRTDGGMKACFFLGCELCIEMFPPSVRCMAVTTTEDELLKGGTIVFQGLQDFESYSTVQTKKVVITGYLHKIWDHTLNKIEAGPTLLTLKMELRRRGFPNDYFDTRLRRFSDLKKGAWEEWVQVLCDPETGDQSKKRREARFSETQKRQAR
ncbi:hypothetical protein CBR_g26245 [Chara braunii]|uniref:Reverse transcriptase domain-containing protein n=1 Tax=Chara braunii TaxID=69332 RepID=A0A388L7J5_CHABU|nr:hypothetical protein CBR_g26245 [Chara braunii]|eukprot:GBG78212.1 hypothetical protein CBR_g26245 [Chara braunii]